MSFPITMVFEANNSVITDMGPTWTIMTISAVTNTHVISFL